MTAVQLEIDVLVQWNAEMVNRVTVWLGKTVAISACARMWCFIECFACTELAVQLRQWPWSLRCAWVSACLLPVSAVSCATACAEDQPEHADEADPTCD